MGSWSVSCGISNIAITAGQKCAILPLIHYEHSRYHPYDNVYLPTALPVFGEYDDYGGMENIQKDDNTKLIEKYFGIKIEEFVEFLVDGKFTYNRDNATKVEKKLVKNGKYDEIKNWRYMWIDAKVYDVMSKCHDRHDKGYLDLGTPEMLNLFGFKKVGESKNYTNYDSKRFNQKWSRGKLEVFSDGRTMLSKDDQYIYHIAKGCSSSLNHYMEIPDDLKYLQELTKHEAWRILPKDEQLKKLLYAFGYDDSFSFLVGFQFDRFYKHYTKNLEKFGDRIAQLINVGFNLYPMSGRFYPFVLYLTPQCGEYETHQILLDEFAKINKSYIDETEEID